MCSRAGGRLVKLLNQAPTRQPQESDKKAARAILDKILKEIAVNEVVSIREAPKQAEDI